MYRLLIKAVTISGEEYYLPLLWDDRPQIGEEFALPSYLGGDDFLGTVSNVSHRPYAGHIEIEVQDVEENFFVFLQDRLVGDPTDDEAPWFHFSKRSERDAWGWQEIPFLQSCVV